MRVWAKLDCWSNWKLSTSLQSWFLVFLGQWSNSCTHLLTESLQSGQEKRQQHVAMDGTTSVTPLGGSVSAGQWGEFAILLNWLQCISFQSCQKSRIWRKICLARQKFSCLIPLTSSGCFSETHCNAPSSDGYLLIGKSSLSQWFFLLSYVRAWPTCKWQQLLEGALTLLTLAPVWPEGLSPHCRLRHPSGLLTQSCCKHVMAFFCTWICLYRWTQLLNTLFRTKLLSNPNQNSLLWWIGRHRNSLKFATNSHILFQITSYEKWLSITWGEG